MSVSAETNLFVECGMPFSPFSSVKKSRNLKRKRSTDTKNNKSELDFKELLKKYGEISLADNAESYLKTVPKSLKIFFTTYIKQVQSMNNTFYNMNQLFENSKNLTNQLIRNQFQSITEKMKSEFNLFTNDLINDLNTSLQKHIISLDLTHVEPVVKLKKIKATDSSDSEVLEKPTIEFSDSDADFSGSDIDLQLEEAVEAVCKKSFDLKSNSEKVKTNENLLLVRTAPSCTALQKDKIYNLHYEPDGYVAVYADGACSRNGQSKAQAGFGVWFADDSSLNISKPVCGIPTNNNAEIQAATHAILQANRIGIKKIRIYTDSKFLINCMTQWITRWKKNNWITAAKEPVKNKESLVELDKVLPLMDAVDWRYVEGHKGIPGNEKADLLAKEGAKKYIIKR